MPSTTSPSLSASEAALPRSEASTVLRLAIVIMAFPSASETFVSGRVKSLSELGVDVEVFSLRPDVEGAKAMAMARGVDQIERSSNSVLATLRGLAAALSRPLLTVRYLRWLIGATRHEPRTLLSSIDRKSVV